MSKIFVKKNVYLVFGLDLQPRSYPIGHSLWCFRHFIRLLDQSLHDALEYPSIALHQRKLLVHTRSSHNIYKNNSISPPLLLSFISKNYHSITSPPSPSLDVKSHQNSLKNHIKNHTIIHHVHNHLSPPRKTHPSPQLFPRPRLPRLVEQLPHLLLRPIL